jgi:1-phosphofructokinase family hexose kinase
VILTVTPNPSLDLLYTTEAPLVWDDANRVAAPRVRPGGQGINLARAAIALGGESIAVALLGGTTGRDVEAMLAAEGTPVRPVSGPGDTRVFVAIRENPAGRNLLVNPRGPVCGEAEVAALLAAIDETIRFARCTWVVASGSTPPGFPADFYAQVGALARKHTCKFVVDCDGDALRIAAESGVCDLLVPNRHEARRLSGADPETPEAAARIAARLREYAPVVALKLGSDGATLADAESAWYARPPTVNGGSAVGAGDAFLAALLLAIKREVSSKDALVDAVAAGTAVLHSEGTDLISAEAWRNVRDQIEVR